MSMKSDKSDGKPAHISIPQKDAIAIVPPKKVRFKRMTFGCKALSQQQLKSSREQKKKKKRRD